METNRCLSETTIQHFLDNELDTESQVLISAHIETCESCSGKVKAQREWVKLVKASVRSSNSSSGIHIPLQRAKLNKKWYWPGKFNYANLTKIAAIIIFSLGSYWFFLQKDEVSYTPSPQELLLWEQRTMGDDANQIWHDRMISSIETNAGGEVIHINTY